jgi:LysM repeat protein
MKKRAAVLLISLFLLSINLSAVNAANNPRNTYEVKSGDYLWKIASTYQTTVENLKLINGLQSDLILVGQKLRVPIRYQVMPGDTLWKLSVSFNSTVESIKTANNGL